MHSFREPGLAEQAAGSPEDLEKGAEKAESHQRGPAPLCATLGRMALIPPELLLPSGPQGRVASREKRQTYPKTFLSCLNPLSYF
ncbi:hypothetical protein D623_10035119 [Myotis brandtii]|uniref:Uncharacterized protein n=1 Tax=Myotis brandtii TaxID=109478 RepID=S7NXS5_MYOBR|nr:hypothetical protein D623_10035119 [Myotis brandtii]